jgi:acyl dehydratase
MTHSPVSGSQLAAVKPGDQLPTLVFGPISRATLALYAGASGDHNPIHIDTDYARSAGLDDVFAPGLLPMAELARLVTEWAGIERLRSLSVRFVAITKVHDEVICSGEVIERLAVEGEPRLRILLRADVRDGRQVLAGEAIIAVA